jgi:hemerythrin-like domain-containing protein
MAMKLTERLKAEHGVFLSQLDYLEELVRTQAPLPTLKAVVETIVSAEEHHAAIEDRLLYPAVRSIIGTGSALLAKSEQEHQEVLKLVGKIRSGSFDEVTVRAFAELMRKHLEREIHDVFTLAEDVLPEDELVSMSNWDAEHLHEANARRQPWAERWLG